MGNKAALEKLIENLRAAGVEVEVRRDPIIPFRSGDPPSIRKSASFTANKRGDKSIRLHGKQVTAHRAVLLHTKSIGSLPSFPL